MTFKNRTALAVSAATAVLSALSAGKALADRDHHHLETVEVYGQAIPATVTSLTTANFAPGRESGDALRNLLGISGSRMGGHGIDPSIRGLSQTQLNIMLDGAYVHGGCPNRMDPPTSYADNGAFEEVTVIRGSQTLAYGGGGPGGTILFKRKTPTFTTAEGIRGKVSGGYRSNSDTSDLNADFSIGNELGYIRIIGNSVHSENYRDGSGDAVRASYQQRGGSFIAGYTPMTGRLIEVSYDRQETLDALFPGAGMDSPEAINQTLRLRAESETLGALSNVNLEWYQSNVDHVMDNYSLRPNKGMRMRAPSESNTRGGRINAEWSSDLGLMKFGLDGQYNHRTAQRFNDTSSPEGGQPVLNSVLWPDVSIDQTGAFVELGQQISEELWLLSGLRYDYVVSEANETNADPAGMALSPDQLYALYYTDPSPKHTDHNIGALLRFEYSPTASQSLWYAGFSRSVRTPDATERYIASNAMMPSGRWVGNPGIAPEAHHQLDLGHIKRWQQLSLDTSLFINDVQDYVLRDRNTEDMNNATIYRNVHAQLMGGEVKAVWTVADSVVIEGGMAYVHAKNITDNHALAQIPPLEGYAKITWSPQSWSVGAELQTAAKQTRVDLTSSSGIDGQGLDVRSTPGWGVINLFGRYQINRHWVFEAGVDNLLNKTFAQHLNRGNAFDPAQIQVNEPGTSAWVSVTASI